MSVCLKKCRSCFTIVEEKYIAIHSFSIFHSILSRHIGKIFNNVYIAMLTQVKPAYDNRLR